MTTIEDNSINPIAMQIGTLIGLFIKENDTYTFNPEWFNDPWKHISAVPCKPELFDLLATLMSSADGSALGTPKQTLERTWYPVLNPLVEEENQKKPTGLYIVASKPVNGKPTEMGIGCLYEWKYDDFSILPYAYFPIINLPTLEGDSFEFILGQIDSKDVDHPVETGIDITGSNGVFNTGNGLASMSFDGFKAATEIYFEKDKYPDIDLTFLNLKLPGERQGSNRSLFDLIQNTSVQQCITVALSVLGSQLAQKEGAAGTAGKMVNSILELLGLFGPVPGIDWESLVRNPQKVAQIFTNWIQSITSNSSTLKSWLNDWYCLFHGVEIIDEKSYVTGNGSRLSPFAVNLLKIDLPKSISINLDFTLASTTSAEGGQNIYPGFRIASSPVVPIPDLPDFGIKVLAEAEVICFTIAPTNNELTTELTFFPKYGIMVSAVNTTEGKPLFDITGIFGFENETGPSKFSIGSISAGFTYDNDTTNDNTLSKIPSPNFILYDVQTPIGSWPVINLTNFNVKTIEEAIGPIVSQAIKTFFGEDNKYAQAITTILGIDKPSSFVGEWPLKDKMLLSPDELGLFVKNPFAALGAYYSRCLSTNDSEGKPLFKYLVSGFSTILGSDSTIIKGDGTEKSPWQIQILALGSNILDLSLWSPDKNDLSIAFDFVVPLPFTSISATFNLHAAMMVLQLPESDGSGKWGASWMQALTGMIVLKGKDGKKLQTPAIGGVSIAVADVYIEGGWKNQNGFYAVGGIEKIELDSSALVIDLGDIIFDSAGWSIDQLKKFTPAILNGIGLLMLENGGKTGVVATTILGLLPNLPSIIDGKEHKEYTFPTPLNLAIPQNWPVLSITNYSKPWEDIVKQVSALYSDGKFMIPLMQLVGWGITGQVSNPPAVAPLGSMADPWSVNLPNLLNIDLLTWKENHQSGYGVQRLFSVCASRSVKISTTLRADVPGIMLDGSTGQTNNYPGLSLLNVIQNPDSSKPLVEVLGKKIYKADVGGLLQLQDGAMKFIPVFRFITKNSLDSEESTNVFELIPVEGKPQYTSNNDIVAFDSMINALMDTLSETSTNSEDGVNQLKSFIDILVLFDIVYFHNNKYSFNPGTWASILSNPGGFLSKKVDQILNSDQKTADLVILFANLLGYDEFKIPATWQGIEYLLQSISLAKNYNGIIIPQFNNWLALIHKPVKYLQTSISALFNNPDALKELITNLSNVFKSTDDNAVKFFSVDSSGTIITIKIPTEKVVKFGSEIQLFADMVIDLKSYTVTNTVTVGSCTLDSAIEFKWAPNFEKGLLSSTYNLNLVGMPGSPQVFDPLPIWPLPENKQNYLAQLGYQIPVTLLSSFAAKYLNDFIVPDNPSVLNIFHVLGMTSEVEGSDKIRPFAGIFMNPVGWILSPEVLGDGNNGINLTKLGQLLFAVTDSAGIKTGSVELKPYEHDTKKDGVQLIGLPWGVSFRLFANAEEGANLGASFSPQLPSPAPDINLSAGIAFGTANGLGIDGKINMSYDLGKSSSGKENTLGITAAYDKKAFTLTANANESKFELLPFGGLSQFLGEGAKALLTIVGDMSFKAYDDYIKKEPQSGLKPFVESIEALTGITDGISLYNFFNNIYNLKLDQITAKSIIDLLPKLLDFVNILKLEGFKLSDDKKLIIYKITFKSEEEVEISGAVEEDTSLNANISFKIGIRNIDGLDVFGLWIDPLAKYSWIVLGLSNTGVGVVLPIIDNKPDLRYEVNVSLGTDFSEFEIPNIPQPTLIMGLKGNLNDIEGPILKFYPIACSDKDGTLEIDLLPSPKLIIIGKKDVTFSQWMLDFGMEFLIPLIGDIALSVNVVNKWLNDTTIADIKGVPGIIMVDWGLLSKKNDKYYMNDIKTAFDLSNPVDIVTKLLFSALNLLEGKRIIPIKENGVYVQSETEGVIKRYGLRIQITDIVVTSKLNSDGAKLVLQIGKYYADQNKDNNWTGLATDPGLAVYFISKNTLDSKLSFLPKFDLISVGLDFAGANTQKPLINVKGVTIQSVEPRAYVSLDCDGGIKTDFGAGIMLYNLGVPLGPGFDNQGPNTNPVAQNLLTSGGDSGKVDAINPAFSVSASYVLSKKAFHLQLYDSNNAPANKVWISIMRALGPLQCRKIGVGWNDSATPKRLDFMFDGQISLAGFVANIIDLDIGIPITDPANFSEYSLDLAGLDLSYNGGAVSVSGGFLKDDSAGYIQYTGQAKIQTSGFALGAFGAYALINDHPSLFIFAYLNAPLGGPPCFFVLGLSGGFGYNRNIIIPPTNKIDSFPFVSGIDNPKALGGSESQPPTNESALQALGNEIVPPKLGSYWLAAGIKFSSFKLIESRAVLMVIFGDDFEIALLGLTELKLPKTGKTYVEAQMAFKITYKVSSGLLAMEAVLTSNSFVIDSNCKLTGGLAFYLWFKNQVDTGARAGEFVFTLGGYHPAFKKPVYFPDEPRLGFSWKVDNSISIKGGAYFALTPSAVMAGASLGAVYKLGNLKAWFNAYADFLIMWNPFYYDIRVGINVGASYTIHFIWTTTFKVELGADLHLWGPDMAGSVTIHWWVISFTIKFGATGTKPDSVKIISWDDFKPYFLPEDKKPSAPPQQQPQKENSKLMAGSGSEQETIPVQQITAIKQITGVLKELPNNDEIIKKTSPTLWQINPDGFGFSIETTIPLNSITITGIDKPVTSDVKFGIKPMGSVVFGTEGHMSTLSITIKCGNEDYKNIGKWNIEKTINGVPESLWGTVNNGKIAIDAKIIPDALVGLTVKIKSTEVDLPQEGPPMFPLSNLGYASWIPRELTLTNDPMLHPSKPAENSDKSLEIIENTIMDNTISALRESILKAVVNAGINVKTDGRLDQMAAYASNTFQSFTMLGELGSLGYTATSDTRSLSKSFSLTRHRPNTRIVKQSVEPIKLRAYMQQYSRPELPSKVFMAASIDAVKITHPVKGIMYSEEYMPEWKLKSIRSLDGSSVVPELEPGACVIVDFDPESPAPLITLKGSIPVFAAWFDEDNQLMGSTIFRESLQLPQSVTQLMLRGLYTVDLQLPYAYGWHFTSELTLVNPNALTGNGVVIIPDSPVRIKNGKTSRGYGLTTGSEMLKGNIITKDGMIKQAGIRTIMVSGLKTLAVIAGKKAESDFSGIVVEVKVKTINGPEYQTLTPTFIIDGFAETAALFELPENTGYDYYDIYTSSGLDTNVTGILGLSEIIETVKDNWQSIVLQPATPFPSAENQVSTSQFSTTVNIQQTKPFQKI
jgi:hypothetical protein